MRGERRLRLPVITCLTMLALVAILVAWCVHPVCMPLSAADVADAAKLGPPLEARTDRQLHGPIFQQRGGKWYQCKSWISRQFFF